MEKRKIVTLVGRACSGKTTVGKALAEELSYSFHSMGNYFREHLKNKIKDYTTIDERIDNKILEIIETENRAIIEGRSCGVILKDYLKIHNDVLGKSIFLDVNRRYQQERYLYRSPMATTDLIFRDTVLRDSFDQKRILEKYGVDIFDPKNYDLVIDTSDKSINDVVNNILDYLSYGGFERSSTRYQNLGSANQSKT